MSCYTRHLTEHLPPEPTPADKRALDRAVRCVLGLPDARCPEVWAAVKARRDDPAFAGKVGEALAGAAG